MHARVHTHIHLHRERSLSCYLTLHHAALHLHTNTRLCSLNLSALLCFNGIKWLELTKEERECCQLPQWGHSHTGSCFHYTTMNMALTLSPSQQLLYSANLNKITPLVFLQLPTRHVLRHAFHQALSCEAPWGLMPSKCTGGVKVDIFNSHQNLQFEVRTSMLNSQTVKIPRQHTKRAVGWIHSELHCTCRPYNLHPA